LLESRPEDARLRIREVAPDHDVPRDRQVGDVAGRLRQEGQILFERAIACDPLHDDLGSVVVTWASDDHIRRAIESDRGHVVRVVVAAEGHAWVERLTGRGEELHVILIRLFVPEQERVRAVGREAWTHLHGRDERDRLRLLITINVGERCLAECRGDYVRVRRREVGEIEVVERDVVDELSGCVEATKVALFARDESAIGCSGDAADAGRLVRRQRIDDAVRLQLEHMHRSLRGVGDECPNHG